MLWCVGCVLIYGCGGCVLIYGCVGCVMPSGCTGCVHIQHIHPRFIRGWFHSLGLQGGRPSVGLWQKSWTLIFVDIADMPCSFMDKCHILYVDIYCWKYLLQTICKAMRQDAPWHVSSWKRGWRRCYRLVQPCISFSDPVLSPKKHLEGTSES